MKHYEGDAIAIFLYGSSFMDGRAIWILDSRRALENGQRIARVFERTSRYADTIVRFERLPNFASRDASFNQFAVELNELLSLFQRCILQEFYPVVSNSAMK